jgi:hypothetical protein
LEFPVTANDLLGWRIYHLIRMTCQSENELRLPQPVILPTVQAVGRITGCSKSSCMSVMQMITQINFIDLSFFRQLHVAVSQSRRAVS